MNNTTEQHYIEKIKQYDTYIIYLEKEIVKLKKELNKAEDKLSDYSWRDDQNSVHRMGL